MPTVPSEYFTNPPGDDEVIERSVVRVADDDSAETPPQEDTIIPVTKSAQELYGILTNPDLPLAAKNAKFQERTNKEILATWNTNTGLDAYQKRALPLSKVIREPVEISPEDVENIYHRFFMQFLSTGG